MRGFLQLLHAVFQTILIHLVKIEAGPDRLQHQDRQLTAEVLTEFLQTVEHAPPSIVTSQFQRLVPDWQLQLLQERDHPPGITFRQPA